jgi:hypothetical protein
MPMSTICRNRFVEHRTELFEARHGEPVASSMTMSEVGSGIALFFASYSSKVWKYVGVKGGG